LRLAVRRLRLIGVALLGTYAHATPLTFEQLLKRRRQHARSRRPRVEPHAPQVDEDLVVLRGGGARQLTAAHAGAPAFGHLGEVALARALGLVTAQQAGQVDVDDEQLAVETVAGGARVLLQDRLEGEAHLGDVLARGGVERLLHDRLLGAAGAAEGALQGRVRAQARLDLREAVRAGKDRDERVRELLRGRVLDGLLSYPDVLFDDVEQLEGADLRAESGQ
jgi:hypothetical protein